MPNLSTPMLNPDGTPTFVWVQFLQNLLAIAKGTANSDPPTEVVIGASPASFVAPQAGTFVSSGGSIVLTRAGISYAIGGVGASVPMWSGDSVTVTYSGAAPTAAFFSGT